MFQTDTYTYIHDYSSSSTEGLGETIHTSRPQYVNIQLWMFKVFIPLCALLIVIVNFIIVVSSGLILHRGQQPRTTYIFLGNVALSDFLMGIIVLFGQYYPKNYTSEMSCCVIMGLTVAATIASFYSVGLIAIDRYLYILYGLQYQRYLSSLKSRLMILGTWIIGFIIGFFPAMGFRNDTNNGKFCWFVILFPPKIIFATVSIGILPIIWTLVLYSIILKHALKKVNELKKAGENADGIQSGALRLFRGRTPNASISVLDDERNNIDDNVSINSKKRNRFFGLFKRKNKKIPKVHQIYNPSKWKAIKIVLFTTGSIVITWIPFYIASVLYAVCDSQATPRYCDNLRVALASPLYILGLTNSILNPIIYAWWHNGFRESIKNLCKNAFCHKKSSELQYSASTRTRISTLSANGNTATNRTNRPRENLSRENQNVVVARIENPVTTNSSQIAESELENSDVEETTRIFKSRRNLPSKSLNDEEIRRIRYT